jgi:hypothetical protein
MWWLWQQEAEGRRYEYADTATNVSLDNAVRMFGLAPDKTVRDYMDVRSPDLCYVH